MWGAIARGAAAVVGYALYYAQVASGFIQKYMNK